MQSDIAEDKSPGSQGTPEVSRNNASIDGGVNENNEFGRIRGTEREMSGPSVTSNDDVIFLQDEHFNDYNECEV